MKPRGPGGRARQIAEPLAGSDDQTSGGAARAGRAARRRRPAPSRGAAGPDRRRHGEWAVHRRSRPTRSPTSRPSRTCGGWTSSDSRACGTSARASPLGTNASGTRPSFAGRGRNGSRPPTRALREVSPTRGQGQRDFARRIRRSAPLLTYPGFPSTSNTRQVVVACASEPPAGIGQPALGSRYPPAAADDETFCSHQAGVGGDRAHEAHLKFQGVV